MIRALLLVIAFSAAATAAAQGIYRWTDDKGKVHYGSEPPPNAGAREVRERINSYSGPIEVQRAPTAAKAGSALAGPVVLYSTSWCGYCAQARAYFARRNIQYVDHDVERSSGAHADFKRLGGKGVPLIVYGRDTMSGFSEKAFEALVARSR